METKLGYRLGLKECRVIRKRKICDHVAASSCKERGSLFTRGNEESVFLIKLSSLTENVGIECPTQTLVGGDEQNKRLLYRTNFQQRMRIRTDHVAKGDKNSVKNLGVRMTGECSLLRFAHLGCSDHLHCLSDLGSVLDRLDASADVAGISHELLVCDVRAKCQFDLAKDDLELIDGRGQILFDLCVNGSLLVNEF